MARLWLIFWQTKFSISRAAGSVQEYLDITSGLVLGQKTRKTDDSPRLPSLQDYSFLPTSTTWTTCLKNTPAHFKIQAQQRPPFPVQAGGIASALFTVWFSHFHSSELWWHEGSICVTKDWTKEDSWSSEGTMQNFPTKPDLNISRLTQEKKCPFQWYFERNDALGRLRKKYLHACPPRIISYLWHKHQ